MKEVMYFHAPWCAPCKTMGSMVDEASKNHPEIDFRKIDVSKEAVLASRFHVQSVPTLLIMKNGRVLKQAGSMNKVQLEAALAT